jgi:hypothetical protein
MKTPYFAFLNQSAFEVDCGGVCSAVGRSSTSGRTNHSNGRIAVILHRHFIAVRLEVSPVLIR